VRSARLIAFLALAAALLFASACGGDGDGSAPATNEPTIDRLATTIACATPGEAGRVIDDACLTRTARATTPLPRECPKTSAAIAAGSVSQVIVSGGRERTYIRHLPPQYGTTPLPVVLNFHGYGSNAQQQERYSRLPQLADSEGFVVITPDGTGERQAWNNLALASLPDDVQFVRDLLDALARDLCIDTSRVFATGISNGAAFSVRLACEVPDRIRAAGAAAAMVYPANCRSTMPTPIIGFHGTADACVPFEGGPVTCGAARLPVQPIPEYARRWAEHNGCAPDAEETRVSEHVRRIAYAGCDAGADVQLYVVEGGGHTWPGSFGPASLGASTTEIDATALIWAFFKAH
jgi:polyhydroxybutyrate depolymerase